MPVLEDRKKRRKGEEKERKRGGKSDLPSCPQTNTASLNQPHKRVKNFTKILLITTLSSSPKSSDKRPTVIVTMATIGNSYNATIWRRSSYYLHGADEHTEGQPVRGIAGPGRLAPESVLVVTIYSANHPTQDISHQANFQAKYWKTSTNSLG